MTKRKRKIIENPCIDCFSMTPFRRPCKSVIYFFNEADRTLNNFSFLVERNGFFFFRK